LSYCSLGALEGKGEEKKRGGDGGGGVRFPFPDSQEMSGFATKPSSAMRKKKERERGGGEDQRTRLKANIKSFRIATMQIKRGKIWPILCSTAHKMPGKRLTKGEGKIQKKEGAKVPQSRHMHHSNRSLI